MGNCVGKKPSEEPLGSRQSRFSKQSGKSSRMKEDSSLYKSEDEEKMSKHRNKVLARIREEKKIKVMDEDSLKETLDLIFDSYDTDLDGELNFDEFMNMLCSISMRKYGEVRGKMCDREEVKKMLVRADGDGNTALDKKEFYNLYKHF